MNITKNKNDKFGTVKIIISGIIMFSIFISIFYNQNIDTSNKFSNRTLKVISSSENEVLGSKIHSLALDNDINLIIEYDDTMNIMSRINQGEKFDAVWSSNSIWLYLINSDVATVTNAKSLSINPVVFGIKKSKAIELGLVNKDVYVEDLVNRISSKELNFAMSNPISTNSGASAYLGILASLAGNPEVLTSDILNNEDLKTKLKDFFKGLSRTSGSEDYLEELFINGDYEAVFTYESSIININQRLTASNKEPLYAIYPLDGVAISDSTLAYIDNKDDHKKELFLKFQNALLSSKGQDILEEYGRRTWYGGVTDDAPSNIFNKEWGIDTTKYITPIKYPSTEVINEALGLYQIELRKPIHVVFCLDFSGSMYGAGITQLRNAMKYILGEEAANDFIQFTKGDKIDIIPFNGSVGDAWSITYDGNNYRELIYKINDEYPLGSTAIYPAASKALELLKDEDTDIYNASVILMTDGNNNVGRYEDLLATYHRINKNIPIFSIVFGSADEDELELIASLTNGKVFDGKANLIEAFRTVRGYN